MTQTIINPDIYGGAKWLRSMGKPMSPFGERVADLLGWVFQGAYHLQKQVMAADLSDEHFVKINVSDANWSTYDNSTLTRLVLAAHDLCSRVEVHAAAHGWLQLRFTPRTRKGCMTDRHATIEEQIERMRSEG